MANAKERLKIFENVIARVGLDGDVLGEYAKAMSSLNGLQTFNELNPPQPPINPNLPPQGANNAVSAPISPEMSGSTASAVNPSQVPQNTPTGIV